jgi:hypothetical protein
MAGNACCTELLNSDVVFADDDAIGHQIELTADHLKTSRVLPLYCIGTAYGACR